jgi:ribosome recycling factor
MMDILVQTMKLAMDKSIAALQQQFQTLRTGRASASLLDKVMVDYYGEPTPLNQIASISIPEPRQLLLKPFSKDDCKAITAAIVATDLGLNPINDGTTVRINLPMLTEDRRKELAKQAKKMADETKVAIRNIRKEYMSKITKDEYTEDLIKRLHEEIEKVTEESSRSIDGFFVNKEKEILTL